MGINDYEITITEAEKLLAKMERDRGRGNKRDRGIKKDDIWREIKRR